jgi:hypothetical protein
MPALYGISMRLTTMLYQANLFQSGYDGEPRVLYMYSVPKKNAKRTEGNVNHTATKLGSKLHLPYVQCGTALALNARTV